MIRKLVTFSMVLAIPMMAFAQDKAPPKKKKVRKVQIIKKGQEVQIRRVLQARPPGQDGVAIFYRAEAGPSSHWIGAACVPASPALLAQLRLESGLVVQRVIEKSPAAKAGLKKYDVLVSFNDKELGSLSDLIKAVGSSKGKKSTLRLVRAGKARAVKVTPAKRPKNQAAGGAIFNLQSLQQFHKHLPGIAGEGNAKLLLVRPGIAVDVAPKAIPGGVRVSMRKENGKTSLEIQKGGKKYSIKSKKDLKKLPKDIQAIAKPLWESGGKHVKSGAQIYRFIPNAPRAIQGFGHAPGVAPKIRRRIEVRRSDDKLDAVLRELKRLRKEVDKLKRRNRRDDDDDDDATT